jgi:hypothetical protein
MVDAGIHVHLDAIAAAQRCGDARLRVRRAEAVLGGDLQHEPAAHAGRLVERVLDPDAVIADRGRHVRQPARGQIGELAAQAEAEHAGLARALRPAVSAASAAATSSTPSFSS